MNIYAELGGSFQQVGGVCPAGWIVMQGQRPSPAHVALEGGIWGTEAPAQEDAQALERAWRDAELAALVWLRDRHRDQLELGAATTLTPEQFGELLVFMQALRDWPQSAAFPDSSARPVPPAFLDSMRPEQ